MFVILKILIDEEVMQVFNKIIEYLDKNIKPNDLVISIGAGPINTNVTKKLIEK